MQSTPVLYSVQEERGFSLLPVRAHDNAVSQLYWIVIIPFLLISLLFFYLLDLRDTSLFVSLALSIIILFNLYFFIFRRQFGADALTLKIELDEIQLLKNDSVLYSDEIFNLKIDQLRWGTENDQCLPAIRIKGEHFPKLIIGSPSTGKKWRTSRQSLEFADYWIISEKEWTRLLKLLFITSNTSQIEIQH